MKGAPAPGAAAPRAIMVLGMHRSGTSALTRIFNLLGADLPGNLLPPSETNEAGYWESRDLLNIHDRVLSSAGSNWHDWRKFNPEWFQSPAAQPLAQEVLDVLRKNFAGSNLFAIKDPRICRFWPLWRGVLEEFGATPAVAMPVRNPLEVAASLKLREGFLLTNSLLLWLRHVLDAENETRGLPRAIVSYESLIEDWQHVIATMTPKLGLSWPRRSAAVDLEIEQYLSAKFKHHNVRPERLAGKPEIVDWVRDAYTALLHLADHPENPADLARLDAVRAEFDRASTAFGVALALNEAELARDQSAIASLKAELTAAQGAVQDAAAAREEAARYAGERDLFAVTIEEEKATAAGLAAALEEEKATAAGHEGQVAALAQELETLRSAMREREASATQLDAELERAQSAAARRQVEIDKLGGELTSTRAVMKDRDGAIVRLMRDLDATRGYLRESQTQVQHLTGELDGARTEVKRGETERARVAKLAADRAAELETARLRITTLRGERDGSQAAAAELPALRAQVEALKHALADARNEADRRERTVSESAAQLAEATNGPRRLAEELERAADAARRSEQSFAAISASRAAASADTNEKAQARIRALQDQLIDTEAALAKYAGGRGNGASWTRHLSMARRRALHQIAKSGLLDAEWYLREYPDAAASGRSPAEHYLDEGYLRGYRPNPLFDTRWYLEHYEDVRRAGVNPLLHYVHNGTREGRDPGPDFHTDFYLVSNPDVRKSGMNPLRHYLRYGRNEGRAATRPGGSR